MYHRPYSTKKVYRAFYSAPVAPVAPVADCADCKVVGGPSHTPSRVCRSGKRAHCSCSACF